MKECPNCIVSVHDEYNVCWNCSYNFTSKKAEGFVCNDKDQKRDGLPPKKIDCLRCKKPMLFGANRKFRKESNDGGFGNIADLLNNRSSYDVYVCPNCEKVEFFLPRVL
jgi:hypothetical protein